MKISEYKLLMSEFLRDITILCMSDYKPNNLTCAGFHPTPSHHAKFAEGIESIILSQL